MSSLVQPFATTLFTKCPMADIFGHGAFLFLKFPVLGKFRGVNAQKSRVLSSSSRDKMLPHTNENDNRVGEKRRKTFFGALHAAEPSKNEYLCPIQAVGGAFSALRSFNLRP